MPLAAQHVQAAHRGHLAAFGLHLLALFDLVDEGVPFLGRDVQALGYFVWSWAQAMASGLPPRMMSVPRPAMFVAMVTAPFRPAWATISASRW